MLMDNPNDDYKNWLETKYCNRKSRSELREHERQKAETLKRVWKYKARKEQEMADIIFVDGVKVKQRFDNLLGVSIKVEDFEKFLKANMNENGYLNIDICKSKDKDAWYARLNTWKPDKKDEEIVKWS